MWILLVLACGPPDGVDLVADLTSAPDADAIPAVRELSVRTAVPTTLEIALDDGERVRRAVFDEPATARTVPVLGLTPGRTVSVTATVASPDGATASETWTVDVPAPPADFPIVEVLARVPDRVEPGWTLVDLEVPGRPTSYLLVLDEAGAPIWWWRSPIPQGDCRLLPNGNLLALADSQGWEVDWLGRVVRHYATERGGEGGFVRIDFDGLNHELAPDGDGFLSLDDHYVTAPLYPRSYADPKDLAPAVIDAASVVSFDADGHTLRALPLSDVLDTRRIGFDSLDQKPDGKDWAHVNGVIRDPRDGGVLVSVRHQDAIVKLDADWELEWILGTHAGWVAPWTDHLLTPVGDGFRWPYHQHAPELTADGTLVMFDNQRIGHNPYEPEVTPSPSRVVGYRVDADARTVEEVFSFDQSSTGPLFSEALGDADSQPITGNILADFGFLDGEGGIENADLGWGRKSVRLVEFAPDGSVVLDIRLRSDIGAEPEGWRAYRSERLPAPWATSGPAAGRWVE